jgi:hypothetical protein
MMERRITPPASGVPPSTTPMAADGTTGPLQMMVPPLARDVARTVRQLGVQSFRASIVELDSMALQATWGLSEQADPGDGQYGEGRVESAFPGAALTIGQLSQVPSDETIAHRLSPRRWIYAWRVDARTVDAQHAVIAEVRYLDPRTSSSTVDAALVRLICDTGILAGVRAVAPPQSAKQTVDLPLPPLPPAPQARGVPRDARLVLLLTAASMLVGIWLAAYGVPRARQSMMAERAEAARLQSQVDGTLTQGLAAALATGDYGQVQEVLSNFAALGYFQDAAVTNASQRIVALAGTVNDLHIGSEVLAEFAASARTFQLVANNERLGRVQFHRTNVEKPATGFVAMQVASGLAFGAAAAAAGVLAWRLLRRRRADSSAQGIT